MARPAPAAAADALAAGIGFLAEIVYVSLPHATARLESRSGRSILYLDRDSSAEDLSWAMLDALRVLVAGSGAAVDGRPIRRHLHVVKLPATRPPPDEQTPRPCRGWTDA
jgi:hypothetical protein